MQMIKLY